MALLLWNMLQIVLHEGMISLGLGALSRRRTGIYAEIVHCLLVVVNLGFSQPEVVTKPL